MIRHYVDLNISIHEKTCKEWFLVTELGKHRIILGFPWLKKINPIIDWQKGTLEWRQPKLEMILPKKKKQLRTTTTITEEEDKEAHLNSTQTHLDEDELSLIISSITGDTDNSEWICSKSTIATRIQAEINQQKKVLPLDQKNSTIFWMFSQKKRQHNFLKLNHGITKSRWRIHLCPNLSRHNLTPQEQIELDKFLKENLEKGYIQPSQSIMASLFFFVDKKDGKLRPYQDYQYLNEHTVKKAYSLSLIMELLDKLKGAKWFTKLDVRWGYNNVWIWDGDQWKAAFKTNQGLFEPTVMFFGLCNSPATFQAMMDDIFSDMITECIIIIYMNIIFLFAADETTLTNNTKKVLAQLQENDLYLKPTKCEFNKTKVEYLGMVTSDIALPWTLYMMPCDSFGVLYTPP